MNEIQAYDTITPNVPIGVSTEIREEIVRNLNQTFADAITLRDPFTNIRRTARDHDESC